MLNRASERSAAALAAIKESVPDGDVTQVECDLLDMESTAAAAQKTLEVTENHIDALVNNAGVMAMKDEASKHGYDVQMQVNHISQAQLTRDLMPALINAADKNGDARIVQHSSGARRGGPLERRYFEKNGGNLGGDSVWQSFTMKGAWKRYQQTKLANEVFALALHEKLQAKEATKNIRSLAAHPGLAATSVGGTSHAIGPLAEVVMNGLSQSADDGAAGIVACMADADAESGMLYGPKGRTGDAVALDMATDANSKEPEQRTLVWEATAAAIGGWDL